MPPTQRGLKKARSQIAAGLKKTKFTSIVEAQKGLCWYCGTPMGGDCTREHLHAQTLGGTNEDPPSNLKAAHAACNSGVGHLPVDDKYRLREIGHSEGRDEMLRVALQMRRADARLAFSTPQKLKTSDKPKPKGYWKRLGLNGRPPWWDG